MRGFKTHRVPPGPRSPTPKAKLPDNSPKGSHGHHPPACHNLRRPFSAPAAPQCNRPERAGAGWNMGVWLKGGPLDTVPSRQRTRLFDDLGFFGVPHTKYVKPFPVWVVGSKLAQKKKGSTRPRRKSCRKSRLRNVLGIPVTPFQDELQGSYRAPNKSIWNKKYPGS